MYQAMAIMTYSTGGKVLTFVKISWPRPHPADVYCIKKNTFSSTACACMRPVANISIRTPKPPILLTDKISSSGVVQAWFRQLFHTTS